VNELASKLSALREVKSPSSDGRLPVKEFSAKFTLLSEGIVMNSSQGKVPVNEFERKSISKRAVRLDISRGRLPTRIFPSHHNVSKLHKIPISDGKDPTIAQPAVWEPTNKNKTKSTPNGCERDCKNKEDHPILYHRPGGRSIFGGNLLKVREATKSSSLHDTPSPKQKDSTSSVPTAVQLQTEAELRNSWDSPNH